MSSKFDEFMQDIINLQSKLSGFRASFMDRDAFKDFVDRLGNEVDTSKKELCITGYFSETIRSKLEEIARFCNVKLICPEFSAKNRRDKHNLEALQKLSRVGVEIKLHNRMHARFLVAHNPKAPQFGGLLVIGSFDFNTECIGKERYDAGIKTTHPDLVNSAIKLFNEIWYDSSSKGLDEVFPS